MVIKDIDLYEYFGVKKPQDAVGVLTAYVPRRFKLNANERIRPAMLIIAGGGYTHVSSRESEPIALAYASQGFNAYTLNYSCAPNKYPTQLIEACMAMAYIRENAKNDFIDENHICAIGFSAGGHLCGMLATMYNEKEVRDVLSDKYIKPNAVILSYPVITSGEKRHDGSFDSLCGDDEKLREKVSIEKRITADAPPAFIWSTYEDASVPCENSLMLATAYKQAGVSFELHIFKNGIHGLSLGNQETNPICEYIQSWFKMSLTWLNDLGFKVKD